MLEYFKNKKVLTLLAHPDDETLGCGGTISRIVEEGGSVSCVFGVRRIENECERALSKLGVRDIYFGFFRDNSMDDYPLLTVCKFFERYVDSIEPDIVITHHYNCTNQDHRICYQAAVIANRRNDALILTCEIPSSTGYLKPTNFDPNFYVKLYAKNVEDKIKSMKCYASEQNPARDGEVLKSLATVRGAESNTLFAEAFMSIKNIV